MKEKVQEFFEKIRNKNIHVVGFSGSEGAAIAFFLHKHGLKDFHLHDFSESKTIKKHFRDAHLALSKEEQDERLEKLLALPAIFHYRDSYLEGIYDADIIFVSQAWYMYECNGPLRALQKSKEFIHITKLYFQLTEAKIIGVTGSNGKTTSSNLINHLLTTAGRPLYFSGNDRGTMQILENIENISANDLLVLEVSNRQLKIDLKKSPHIGVITNITPNHLKEYDSFEEYRRGKAGLLQYQGPDDYSILNYDDDYSKDIINEKLAKSGEAPTVFGFSTKQELEKGCFVKDEYILIKDPKQGDEPIEVCPLSALSIKGEHNIANTCAAFAASYLAGLSPQELAAHISSFKGVSQRQEHVATINGVEYYNDTSSTSPDSLIAAIDAMGKNTILIAGGRNKDLDISELVPKIEDNIKHLILLESPFAEELIEAFTNEFKEKIHRESLLKQAIQKAHELARFGDKVILSPGAEYFVYFKNKMPGYKNFRTFVQRLK